MSGLAHATPLPAELVTVFAAPACHPIDHEARDTRRRPRADRKASAGELSCKADLALCRGAISRSGARQRHRRRRGAAADGPVV